MGGQPKAAEAMQTLNLELEDKEVKNLQFRFRDLHPAE